MYTLRKVKFMDSMNAKAARQQFAKLINTVGRGRAVAITRRGKIVAQLTPITSPQRPKLPDLSAFRATLAKPAKKSAATIRHLRQQERA